MTQVRTFNIQRYSIHDRPGIRTTIFLKGCPLRCGWCCNPESQSYFKEMYFEKAKCIACSWCEKVCPKGIKLEERLSKIDQCHTCEQKSCLTMCPSGAISVMGEDKSVEELLFIAGRDKIFYDQSGGGVTVSGGEPLMNPDFIREFFEKCQEKGIHTAIESCMAILWENVEKVMPYTDLFLTDLKHTNQEKFHQWTGGNLSQILTNIQKLVEKKCKVIIRVPMIPGFNATEEEIGEICKQAAQIGVEEISLLPYHRLGMVKYESFGREYPMKDVELLREEEIGKLKEIPAKYGLKLY